MHKIAPSVLFYIILYHVIGKISNENRNKKCAILPKTEKNNRGEITMPRLLFYFN